MGDMTAESPLGATSSARASGLKRWAPRIALAVAGPLVMLGVLEGVAYVWERQQADSLFAWELVASRRIDYVEHTAPGAGYTLMRPGAHYAYRGIAVDINRHGLRGPEVEYAKPAGTYRILNLGDSVAMGWGVAESASYGRQLEAALNAAAGAGRHYEVINAGVPGWDPQNELAYLQDEGLKYQPDLILLECTLVNDIFGGSAVGAHAQAPPIKWLRAHTYFWPFLTVEFQWLKAAWAGRARIPVIDPPHTPESFFPLDRHATRWTDYLGWLEDIERTAAAANVPVIIVLFPIEYQVTDPSFPTLPQQQVIGLGQKLGTRVVDLLSPFQQACAAKPGGRCQVEDRYLFADVWMHPSAVGNTIAARAINDALAVE